MIHFNCATLRQHFWLVGEVERCRREYPVRPPLDSRARKADLHLAETGEIMAGSSGGAWSAALVGCLSGRAARTRGRQAGSCLPSNIRNYRVWLPTMAPGMTTTAGILATPIFNSGGAPAGNE